MVFNATFSNIWAISWRSVLLVEETKKTIWVGFGWIYERMCVFKPFFLQVVWPWQFYQLVSAISSAKSLSLYLTLDLTEQKYKYLHLLICSWIDRKAINIFNLSEYKSICTNASDCHYISVNEVLVTVASSAIFTY
jgi:hypothetical protein